MTIGRENGDNKLGRNPKFLHQLVNVRLPETTGDPDRTHRLTPTIPRQPPFLLRNRVYLARRGIFFLLVALLL
ncbi:UNVERIFIED_CONTAM: hypothetical protein Sradi_0665700 [Sesamum radiatum]|uniref:Uncharacterized protein n=1 Tax=Sesamum radiatum TaxID=300843 RepID=A0AAW2VQP3_SESRA